MASVFYLTAWFWTLILGLILLIVGAIVYFVQRNNGSTSFFWAYVLLGIGGLLLLIGLVLLAFSFYSTDAVVVPATPVCPTPCPNPCAPACPAPCPPPCAPVCGPVCPTPCDPCSPKPPCLPPVKIVCQEVLTYPPPVKTYRQVVLDPCSSNPLIREAALRNTLRPEITNINIESSNVEIPTAPMMTGPSAIPQVASMTGIPSTVIPTTVYPGIQPTMQLRV